MYIVETQVKDPVSGGFFLIPYLCNRTKMTSKVKALEYAKYLTTKGHDRVVVYHQVRTKPTTTVFEHRKGDA